MKTYKPVKILLVEDNQDDVLITERALHKNRVANELNVVRDGQEALDYLFGTGSAGERAPRPDLILLDVNLPRVNGMEVLERIRSDNKLAVIHHAHGVGS